MKKLIGLAVVSALVSSALPAQAEILKNLKTTGELDILGVAAKNVSLTDATYKNTQTRLSYGMMFDLLDDLHANITLLKDNRFYGNGAENLQNVQNSVVVDESNIVMDNLFGGKGKIGRQYYGEEGDIVAYYGVRHGAERTAAVTPVNQGLDAMRYDYSSDKLNGHVVWAKTNESSLTADQDTSFWGVNAMYKMMDSLSLGGYVYNNKTAKSTIGLNGSNLYIIGVKANGNVIGMNYSAEAAFNRGAAANVADQETPSYVGYAFLGKLGYKMDIAGHGFNPRAMFAYGSGDNQGTGITNASKDKNFYAINPDFRPGEIFGNSPASAWDYSSTYSLQNLTVANLGIDYMPANMAKLSTSADFFKFAANSVAAGTPTHIGSEIDLKANYKYAENVTLSLALARFYPEEATKAINANHINKIATNVNVRF